ncbi:MAG: hypothetical protein RBS73_09730 [Prolixibacteraceae bacterium]|jgi:hypothetical protein|nr:hypothetical protein [Prolixibacteraceae bacterium]
MYIGLLHLHSTLRWLILALAVIVLVKYYMGWAGNKKWKKPDHILAVVFTSLFDLQLLTGLVLYFFVSPVTQAAFADFGAAMKNPDLRFYAVEHFSIMLAALVLIHIGRARSKRAASDQVKFKIAAIFFSIAMILVLAGIPWSKL